MLTDPVVACPGDGGHKGVGQGLQGVYPANDGSQAYHHRRGSIGRLHDIINLQLDLVLVSLCCNPETVPEEGPLEGHHTHQEVQPHSGVGISSQPCGREAQTYEYKDSDAKIERVEVVNTVGRSLDEGGVPLYHDRIGWEGVVLVVQQNDVNHQQDHLHHEEGKQEQVEAAIRIHSVCLRINKASLSSRLAISLLSIRLLRSLMASYRRPRYFFLSALMSAILSAVSVLWLSSFLGSVSFMPLNVAVNSFMAAISFFCTLSACKLSCLMFSCKLS